jgi:acetyl-CoA C-acetyltransferase
MRQAVIVSTASTPMTRLWAGGLDLTHSATMSGHVIAAAGKRSGDGERRPARR